MSNPHSEKAFAMIFSMVVMVVILFVSNAIYERSCHGQCGHGDKRCQERCFAKGECPMEQKFDPNAPYENGR